MLSTFVAYDALSSVEAHGPSCQRAVDPRCQFARMFTSRLRRAVPLEFSHFMINRSSSNGRSHSYTCHSSLVTRHCYGFAEEVIGWLIPRLRSNLTSTRRFCARPAAVVLSATAAVSP